MPLPKKRVSCLNRYRHWQQRWLAVALMATAVNAAAQDEADDVKSWLDRMNSAVESLNYRGSFVHVIGNNAETLNIAHRNADGEVRELIRSAEGSGREILRTPESVRSVLPDERLVVLEEPKGPSIAVASSLNYTDELENYYTMTTKTKGHVADRDTQVVSIRARDEYRFGYLLYLDLETALPLRSEIRDDQGRVVEQMLFTTLEVVDALSESAVEPVIDVEGFTWRRPVNPEPEAAPTGEIWGATRLPTGFGLSISRQSLLAGSTYPVQHLVYTDGLATVSVFISHPKSEVDMPEGFNRYGSTNAFTIRIDGRLATAMGEVPRRTVQMIATSLDVR